MQEIKDQMRRSKITEWTVGGSLEGVEVLETEAIDLILQLMKIQWLKYFSEISEPLHSLLYFLPWHFTFLQYLLL